MRTPTALSCLALASALALACGSGRPPATPAATSAATPAPPSGTVPDNASTTALLPAPAPTLARAVVPEEPQPDIPIQWTVDESIATPRDVPKKSVLAKFHAADGSAIVVYEMADGTVIRRRIRGLGGKGGFIAVEEKAIDELAFRSQALSGVAAQPPPSWRRKPPPPTPAPADRPPLRWSSCRRRRRRLPFAQQRRDTASSSARPPLRRGPGSSSISAAERTAPKGLARPVPAYFGAQP